MTTETNKYKQDFWQANFIRYRGLNLSKSRTNIKTEYIPKKTVQKIFNAYDFATYINNPINYFVVIHLKDGISKSANTAFCEIRNRYSNWLRYSNGIADTSYKPTYVYTFENPANNTHVNWCLHIPEELEDSFSCKIHNWVERVEGDLKSETIYVTKINPASPKAVANYITKGVNPEYAENFFLSDIQDKKGPQGTIFGKRAGYSQSIGKTAQARAEFDPTKYRAKRMGRRNA